VGRVVMGRRNASVNQTNNALAAERVCSRTKTKTISGDVQRPVRDDEHG
jgi:hypothetical protein